MSCGTCKFCCRNMAVAELSKPDGEWCRFAHRSGCDIYSDRPQSCRDFSCYWLSTQSSVDPKIKLPLEFRPDKSRCMIVESTPSMLVAKCDPREPMAWMRQPMFTFLYMSALTRAVFVQSGKRVFAIFNGGRWTEVSDQCEIDAQGILKITGLAPL